MSNQENVPNFINGIGVLNYTIETKSIETSEFYLPEVPNIKIYADNDARSYQPYGWLFGGNDIVINFNTLNRLFR